MNPLWMWVSLSSRLSPGRPRLLAEECMGVGSFNKGNSLSGPRDGPGLYFSSFPSRVSLWTQSGLLLLLLLLLRFKHNGFTLRLREKDTEEGRSPELKLWLTYCMPMLSTDILLELNVVLSAIQQTMPIHIFEQKSCKRSVPHFGTCTLLSAASGMKKMVLLSCLEAKYEATASSRFA